MKMKQLFFGLLLSLNLIGFAQNSTKEVLFTIDNKSYFTDEFSRVYKKNLYLVKDESQKDLNQYLELFVGYKLKINNASYVIPLWHHELVYDNSGNDIYVQCKPILPENIYIDEKNNIIVDVSYCVRDILEQDILTCSLTKDHHFYIKRENLKLKKYQKMYFIQQGISRINTKNIFDVTNKGDVIFNILLDND
jgi:hypothetical protein